MDGIYTLPGDTLPDGETENRQSAERTSNERLTRLGEEVAVKEVSTQLISADIIREAESSSMEVFVQRLNKLSLRLVFSGPELDWVISLRVERSIAKPKLKCCR